MPNPSLTFLHTAPHKHSSSSSVCSGLLPDEVKFLRQEWKDRRGRRGMWGQLLLHFIRKLIWRLSKWILSLSFLWSPPQLEDERRCGEAGGMGQGSAQITSRLFFLADFSSERFSFPACRLRMSVICFYFLYLSHHLPAWLSVTPV